MKTRLIIISIIVIIVVSSGIVYAISVINEPKTAKDCRFTYGKGGQEMLDCLEKIRDNSSIPSAQEFLKMDCDDLNHIFPEFPSEEVADAWNTRMHECINEQESLQSQANELGMDKGIVTEMENLQQMSCDEIIQRNTEGEYRSSDNREFAREKTLDCSDIEESFAVNASCEELYERYHSGQQYWFEDHKQITENRLAKCSEIVDNEN
ncbi:hypothetical protein [Nitrosopumilus adriaticus]|uniref:Uncharacterized protein n=1 Tax=Nitrosopumilus adriaticus TaxID=1580092 RepID=A0A0D5C1U9_9ARCH|nr:hypothetical protein [Nitrosopumilus adriaticus]AJW70285.1 exported protein of unknown function [Nitrosopumilus adriaticus]